MEESPPRPLDSNKCNLLIIIVLELKSSWDLNKCRNFRSCNIITADGSWSSQSNSIKRHDLKRLLICLHGHTYRNRNFVGDGWFFRLCYIHNYETSKTRTFSFFFFLFFEVAFQGPGSNFKLPLTTECVVVYFSPKVLKRVIVAVSGY